MLVRWSTTLVQILVTVGWIVMSFGTNVRASQRMKFTDFGDVFPPECHHEAYPDIFITITWISMTFGSHIQVPLRNNCNNCGDSFTFHLAPSSGQSFGYFDL